MAGPQPPAPRGALETLELALFLVRDCRMGDLACYLVGSLPFVLALLYFLHDMRYDAFADAMLGAGALGLAFLYVWMKCWQTVFARRLTARMGGSPAPIGLTDLWSQVAIQPTSLFLLPLSFLLALPYGWVYAYYQNVTVTGNAATARTYSVLWPKQNHFLILLFFAFRLVVFLNILIALVMVPELVRAFLGIESVFTENPFAMLNTTILGISTGLTYLAVGPIGIAAYVVRCFHGESSKSGIDLRVEMDRWSAARGGGLMAGAALILCALLAVTGTSASERHTEEAAPVQQTVNAGDLGRAIERVLQRREFAWRLQRQQADRGKAEKGLIARAMTSILEVFNEWVSRIGELIESFINWLGGGKQAVTVNRQEGWSWRSMARGLLVVLMLAGIVALVYLLRRHRSHGSPAGGQAFTGDPRDVSTTQEHQADRIASDRWMDNAKELIARGNLRDATRAVYMAILSRLSRGGLLVLAANKTNRDYRLELLRRVGASPELPDAFSTGVRVFERVWYGRHEPSPEQLQRLSDMFYQVESRVEV